MAVVWLPYPAAELDPYGGLPSGLEVDVYDAESGPPASIADVEFYVPPYLKGQEPATLTARMPSLRVMQTLTAGVDNYLPYVPPGVTLCNAKGVHDAATSEVGMALILAAQRGIDVFARAQDRGEWAHAQYAGLADRRVLLIGTGAVGEAFARRLDGFECELIRVARTARDGVAGVDELPSLLPTVDIVVLLVPWTAETTGLVDAAFLARMKDGALLVNLARGPVVRTDDLLAELNTGRLRAALDVTDPEPLPADHPLWHAPGVLISPHVGGNTSAMKPRALRLLAEQLRRFTAGEPLLNVITGEY